MTDVAMRAQFESSQQDVIIPGSWEDDEAKAELREAMFEELDE
jgi:hypothetical protein